MPDRSKPWRDRISGLLPHPQQFCAHPWLRPVAHRLLHPSLWRPRHEAVARGAAVGAFWAFMLPFAQIFVAAAHCSFWRANIPVAAAMTMVTNPVTIGFWLWLAYQLGATLMGAPAAAPPVGDDPAAWLGAYGLPALLGMGIFAVGGATLSYLVVKLVWRLRVYMKRRSRLTRVPAQ